jgi:Family of unknown function (DUF6328)
MISSALPRAWASHCEAHVRKSNSGSQRDLSLACLVLAAVATALLLEPTACHRLVFRRGQKESLAQVASVMAIADLLTVAWPCRRPCCSSTSPWTCAQMSGPVPNDWGWTQDKGS